MSCTYGTPDLPARRVSCQAVEVEPSHQHHMGQCCSGVLLHPVPWFLSLPIHPSNTSPTVPYSMHFPPFLMWECHAESEQAVKVISDAELGKSVFGDHSEKEQRK